MMMDNEIKPSELKPSVFIGQKKPSGKVKDVTKEFKVHNWGVMVRLKKIFEGSNSRTAAYGNGWALNWFLEAFPKYLDNLHCLNIKSGIIDDDNWKTIVEAEYYMTGLTSEDDVEQWAKDRIEDYRTMPVRAGGYTYHPRIYSWDAAEIIGEISVS